MNTSPPDNIIFIKQQGAMRTGTNLVKFLLEENFTNVRVLVNIGRWKHATAETPFNWRGIDWEGEGRSVDVLSRINSEDLAAVRAAFDAGAVRFAISVRDIYSWLVSYIRFRCLNEMCHIPPLKEPPREHIVEALEQWNVLYGGYLSLLNGDHGAMLFRLEDLMTDLSATLDRARLLWGLKPRHARYVRPTRYMRAGIDGQSRSELLHPSLSFDRRRHLGDNGLTQLSDEQRAIIRQTVDDDILRAYGYETI